MNQVLDLHRKTAGLKLTTLHIKFKRVNLTGTIQKNRVGLPAEIKRLRLRNNDLKVYRHQNDMMNLAWQDRRLILMLSKWHNADTTPHHR